MKILLVRNDRIGDLLLALPAMEALLEAGHQVAVWASPYAAPLLERDSRIQLLRGEEELRQGAFDLALVLFGSWRNAWALQSAGIPERWGASGRPYSLLYSKRLPLRRSQGLKSEADYNLDFVRALGLEAPLKAASLHLGPEDHDAAVACLQAKGLTRPVILHPGSLGSAQNWGPERYARLGKELRDSYGVELLISAGPGEFEVAASIGRELNVPALTEGLPLRTFAALLGKSQLFVSASTGPMHLAAAQGAPTLSLFPPIRAMSPRRWGPLGNRHAVLSPAGLGHALEAHPGLNFVERISVAEALAAARFLLKDAYA